MENKFYFKFSERNIGFTFWIKFCLIFIKTKIEVDSLEGVVTEYKILKGKMYILKQRKPDIREQSDIDYNRALDRFIYP